MAPLINGTMAPVISETKAQDNNLIRNLRKD